MSEIIREAALITQELKNVVFVGVVAVTLHAGEQRYSNDIDFVIVNDTSNSDIIG